MLKILLVLLISTVNVFSQSSIDQRRKEIISIIDEELSEVNRLSRTTSRNRADYLLRSAELYLEKARVWKEKENEDFLELSDARRRKVNKKSFFRQSTSYFSQAKYKCEEITRRYPKYSNISDVYYILGYYAKEVDKNKTASRYFNLARKKSSKKSVTRVKANISLAEVYYNQKKYAAAIPLYNSALNSHKDKWWTKDSFNLAWSYFKVNQFSKAISKMREVYAKSSEKKYVNMRSQVERDIGLFYATAGQIEEGIEFYKKIGINFTDQLLKIAKLLKKQGSLSRAKTVLAQALKYEKDEKKKVSIYVEQLSLFSTYNRDTSHLGASKSLYRLHQKGLVKDSNLKLYIYEMKKNSAKLQKQVVSKVYKRLKKKRAYKAGLAKDYFAMLEKVDSKNALEHAFLRAETDFFVKNYSDALKEYTRVFNASAKANNKEYKTKSMEGVLSCLAKRSIPAKTKEKYYAPVYESYVKYFPRSNKTPEIYRKLFQVYLGQNKLVKAKGVIDRYNKLYPKDFVNTEAMIANLMEKHRSQKDNNAIKGWIQDIEQGKYKVSAKYQLRLRELLTSMQIAVVQGMLKSGNKKEALIGYHKVLKDPHSTEKSKINAKYNLAALYYELGKMQESYKWSVQSIAQMSSKEVSNFSDSFLTISSYLFLKMQFLASADLSKRIVAKLCREKGDKKIIAFKNSSYLYLAEGKTQEVYDMLKLGTKCGISKEITDEIKIELAKEFSKSKKYELLEKMVNEIAYSKGGLKKVIPFVDELYELNKAYNNSAKTVNFYKMIQKARAENSKSKNYPLEALNVFAKFEIKKLESSLRSLELITLNFPETTFNNTLKSKLQAVDRLSQSALSIQNLGSTIGLVESYRILIKGMRHTIFSIETFTPPGKSPEYVTSFKKSMLQVVSPLKQTLAKYEKDAKLSIESNEVLTAQNKNLLEEVSQKPFPFYIYEKGAFVMSRRGNK